MPECGLAAQAAQANFTWSTRPGYEKFEDEDDNGIITDKFKSKENGSIKNNGQEEESELSDED